MPLVGGILVPIVGFGGDEWNEALSNVDLVTAISLWVTPLVSHAVDVRARAMIGVMAGSVASCAHGINIDLLDEDANIWAATSTALESVPTLPPRETALVFGSGCCCWPRAVWDWRAFQA